LNQVARDFPGVLLHRRQLRLHLVVDKLTGRVTDHPLLFGQVLGRKYLIDGLFGDQKLAALHVFPFHLCFHSVPPGEIIITE
jgi:hypothetical protein